MYTLLNTNICNYMYVWRDNWSHILEYGIPQRQKLHRHRYRTALRCLPVEKAGIFDNHLTETMGPKAANPSSYIVEERRVCEHYFKAGSARATANWHAGRQPGRPSIACTGHLSSTNSGKRGNTKRTLTREYWPSDFDSFTKDGPEKTETAALRAPRSIGEVMF